MSPATGTPVLPLSRLLREETRAVHERVEHTAAFNRLIVVRLPGDDDPRIARARDEYRETYRRFLIASHGFEAAVEQALEGSPARASALASGWTPESGDASPRIRADLTHAFGASAARGLPAMDGLPAAPTLATFAGIEYVRRGSRAGGAVIGAVVRHNLGFDADAGASFVCRYGRETRSVLDGLRTWLDGLALDAPGRAAALHAALATFEAVAHWHVALEQRFARGDA